MGSKIKVDLAALILKLIHENNKTSLQDIARAAGLIVHLAKNRRAIQRVLAKMIESKSIQTQGHARARIYIPAGLIQHVTLVAAIEEPFTNIDLSTSSIKLLEYVSQPIRTRIPVGYNQSFLRQYDPGKTQYLSDSLREELFHCGNMENIERKAGTYVRNILNRLLIDLSWNSSRLEGNTYSLLETKRLIELGENASGKDATEAQMILNHKNAIEYIVEASDETKTNKHQICSIHALLSENLLGDSSASGRLRNLAVGISGTVYLPLDNPHVLRECFDIFIEKLNLIQDPFEQSFFALVQLSYMQAFEDVNKRTARLAANIPFIKYNLNPLSFIDVNQTDYVLSLLAIYEQNDVSLLRDLYVWAYKRSSQRYSAIQQSMGEPNLFKMKYRNIMHDIIRSIILEKVSGAMVVSTIKQRIDALMLPAHDSEQLFNILETEIMSLHNGNIAMFKLKPLEFESWKILQ